MVERKGKPVAAIVSPEEYKQIARMKEEGREAINELRALNADQTPEDVYNEVTAVVEQVRQENYDKRRKIIKKE